MHLTLLRRANRKPRTPVVLATPTLAQVKQFLPLSGDYGVDIETRGLAAEDPANFIVGIGFAGAADQPVYVDLRGASDEVRSYLKDVLKSSRLTCFNCMFDGTWLRVWTGEWLNWYLDSYALFKQLSTEGYPGQSWSLEVAQREVLGWDTSNKDVLNAALKERGLSKGDMWQLPAEIIGEYCALDADAAWQLAEELTAQATPWPQLLDYHRRVFLTEVRLLAEQQIRGIQVDEARLQRCYNELLVNIEQSMAAFLTHPEVAPHVAAHNEAARQAWLAAEPPRTTAKGEVSARWEAWRDREARHMDDKGFNPNSKQQLEILFYDRLGYPVRSRTETGRRSVDRKVLPVLGEPGKLLNGYNLLVKRRGYVEAVIEKSRRDGCVHPQFNSVGTVTTRLGGSGGLNLQQMPKDPAFLSALAARPGYKLVQADAEALEPTILTEFSQDKTLLALYGPAAKQNDAYLYIASKIPALGREIVRYYDPDNPTPEGIAQAKKLCKRDRHTAKTCKLAYDYGAGAPKMHETLVLAGIDITLGEVREIRRGLDVLFAGIKRFDSQLQDMWMANGGWIPSILGTPICVAEQFLKDIVNRFCQTSGHMVLQLWIYHTSQVLAERGIPYSPWLVDQHDEMVLEVPEEWAGAAAEAIGEGLARTNSELGMGIKIKGPACIADNFAEIKCENYEQWLEEQTDDDENDYANAG